MRKSFIMICALLGFSSYQVLFSMRDGSEIGELLATMIVGHGICAVLSRQNDGSYSYTQPLMYISQVHKPPAIIQRGAYTVFGKKVRALQAFPVGKKTCLVSVESLIA